MQIVLDLFSAHVGPKTVFPLSSVCTKKIAEKLKSITMSFMKCIFKLIHLFLI